MADESIEDQAADFRQASTDFHLAADALGVDQKKADIYANMAIDVAGSLVSGIGRSISSVLDFVGQALEVLEDKASIVFTPFMARMVGHALGADVSTDAIRERLDRSGSSQIGNVTAQTVFDMLAPPDGELEPGDDGAKRMVGALGHMTVTNWTEGIALEWLAEYLGWDVHLEALPELADKLIANMGLSRLARTALRPLARIVVATPLEWKLNKQYRPKMLSVNEAIHVWRRGAIDEQTVDEIGARDGLGDDALAALKATPWSPLSPADARFLVNAGVWDQAIAFDELRVSEGTDDRIALAWQLEDLKAVHKFELDMVTAAATAYAERKIDEPRLLQLLSANTIDTTTLNRIHELASQRRSVNVLHLSRGDVEQAVELEVLSVTDYHDWLEARGYAVDDALTLELLLQAKLKKADEQRKTRAAAAAARAATQAARAQAAQTKRDLIAGEHAHWSGTLGQAERLVVRGLMPALLYRQILIDHTIAPADADELVAVATQDRDARTALLAKRAAAKASGKPPAVPLATLVHAILLGARPIDALAPAMSEAGYSADDIALETDVVRQELADRAAAAAVRAAKAPAGTTRALTLAQLERAVLNGAGTIDRYRAALVAAGFSATDTALLVADLQARLEAKAFADERRALAEQKFEASHLSLATLEKAVVDGVQTLDDYRNELAARGLDGNDQAILVALLELKLPAA